MTTTLLALPQCRWRGAEVTPDHFLCSSAKVLSGRAGVAAALCAECTLADHKRERDLSKPKMTYEQLAALKKKAGT